LAIGSLPEPIHPSISKTRDLYETHRKHPFGNNPGPNESALVKQLNDMIIAAPPQ
jgi:hypothetical protein